MPKHPKGALLQNLGIERGTSVPIYRQIDASLRRLILEGNLRPGQKLPSTRELADELGVPLLGKLPLTNALREGGDDGRPITAVEPESETAKAFHEIARQIAVDMKPKKVYSDALKVI